MDTVKTKITGYMASHHYLRLGTTTAQCTPQVHTVGYVSEGCIIYFVTDLEKIPPNPDLVIFKVEPVRGFFLDSTVAFGHRDMVDF
jgi:hypothetical protein